MDEIPVPEIVELSPAPGPASRAGLGRWPLAQEGMRRARPLVALVALVGAAALVLRWGPFGAAIGERTAASSPASDQGSPSPEAIPAALLHAWERPYEVAPGPNDWGSGSLGITSGSLAVRKDPDPTVSTSSVTASGTDSLVVTATADTLGCRLGDLGTYRVALGGKDTVLTLTASGPDACPRREAMLAGPWVRADFPPPAANTLSPGRYQATVFDPFGGSGSPRRLSFAVPAGWEVADDSSSSVTLHRVPDPSAGGAGPDPFIIVMARPAVTVDRKDGAPCEPPPEEPGVGHGLADIVRAITTRPGLVSTLPKALTIGGFEGTLLDLHIAPSWTHGCVSPDGPVVAIPLLRVRSSSAGPLIGVSADRPLRLILLDLGDGKTLAIAPSSSQFVPSEALAALVMPIIESFEFVPAPDQASGPTPEVPRREKGSGTVSQDAPARSACRAAVRPRGPYWPA